MHGTHPHPPRPTKRDPPPRTGELATRAAATAEDARAGTEAYEGLRDAVDDETDARTMTRATTTRETDTGFDDARRAGTATRVTGVTSP